MGCNMSTEQVVINKPPTNINPTSNSPKKAGKGNPTRKSFNYESNKEINSKSLRKSSSPNIDKNFQGDVMRDSIKFKDGKDDINKSKGIVLKKNEPANNEGSRLVLPTLEKKRQSQSEIKLKRSLTGSKLKSSLFEIQKNPQNDKIDQERHQFNKTPIIVRKKQYTLQNLIQKYRKQEEKNHATLKSASTVFQKQTTSQNQTNSWRSTIKIADTPNPMTSSMINLKKSPSKPKGKKKQLNPLDSKLGALVKIYALD